MLVKQLTLGAKDNLFKLVLTWAVTFAAGWSVIEPIIGLAPNLQQVFQGTNRLALLAMLSVIVALVRIARPKKISFNFRNHKISIKFGNLFDEHGYKVIPVSRRMHEIDVVKNSLQDQVIQKFKAGNGLKRYHQQLNEYLDGKFVTPVGTSEALTVVEVGTVAMITNNDERYIYLALTETEVGDIPEDNCSTSKLWTALERFWQQSGSFLRGENVNVPLIGGGVAGIPLSPDHLLTLLIVSLLSDISQRNGKITTGEINIILHKSYFEAIDLRTHKQKWLSNY